MSEFLRQFSYAEPRLGLYVFGAFAGLGLALVILGVYSVIAYNVSRQTQEIGIRMALGAERSDVLRMTLRTGLQLVAIGVVIGVSVSLAATRVLASQLWNVSPSDPLTLSSSWRLWPSRVWPPAISLPCVPLEWTRWWCSDPNRFGSW